MKTILSAFTLLSLSSIAHAASVSDINCVATNGVTISGEAKDGAPFTVTSTWGYFQKDFTISRIDSTAANKINVSLVAKDGPSYLVSLFKEEAPATLEGVPVSQETFRLHPATQRREGRNGLPLSPTFAATSALGRPR